MYKLNTTRWTIERAVFLLAGIIVFASVMLGLYVHSYWLYFTAFVGVMLLNFALTGLCPSAIILHKCGLKGSCEKK